MTLTKAQLHAFFNACALTPSERFVVDILIENMFKDGEFGEFLEEIRGFIVEGRLINAIKHTRQKAGESAGIAAELQRRHYMVGSEQCGLMEAKKFVEDVRDGVLKA